MWCVHQPQHRGQLSGQWFGADEGVGRRPGWDREHGHARERVRVDQVLHPERDQLLRARLNQHCHWFRPELSSHATHEILRPKWWILINTIRWQITQKSSSAALLTLLPLLYDHDHDHHNISHPSRCIIIGHDSDIVLHIEISPGNNTVCVLKGNRWGGILLWGNIIFSPSWISLIFMWIVFRHHSLIYRCEI